MHVGKNSWTFSDAEANLSDEAAVGGLHDSGPMRVCLCVDLSGRQLWQGFGKGFACEVRSFPLWSDRNDIRVRDFDFEVREFENSRRHERGEDQWWKIWKRSRFVRLRYDEEAEEHRQETLSVISRQIIPFSVRSTDYFYKNFNYIPILAAEADLGMFYFFDVHFLKCSLF